MKIGITSDLHYGYDKGQHCRLEYFLKQIPEVIDILLIAGDWAACDPDNTKSLIRLIRSVLPELPIAGVWGNHDFWQKRAYYKSYDNPMNTESLIIDISKYAKDHNITIFTGNNGFMKDGIYLTGWDGWYALQTSYVNDHKWMPRFEQHLETFSFLRNRSWQQFAGLLAELKNRADEYDRAVVITHFHNPYLTSSPFYHFCGEGVHFNWLESLSKKPIVITGHSHRRMIRKYNDVLYLNSGSDYANPRLLVLDTDNLNDMINSGLISTWRGLATPSYP